MKKLLLILLCLPMIGFGQQKTYVPDDNFETYLENNGTGDGVSLNDSVLTANINTITHLDFSSKSSSEPTCQEGGTEVTL